MMYPSSFPKTEALNGNREKNAARFVRFFRVCFFTLSMYLVTHALVFILLPVGICLTFLGFQKRLLSLKVFFSSSLFRIIGKKIEIKGVENVPEGEPDYLVISNYPSFYSIFALMSIFPDAAMVAHSFLSKMPIMGTFLKLSGYIFVSSAKSRKAIQNIDRALDGRQAKRPIIIFPEGKRSLDGTIYPFRRGFVYILRKSRRDLLPVTMNGFYCLKPMKRPYLDPSAELQLVFHPILKKAMLEQMSDVALIQKAKNIIQAGYRM